MSEKKDICRIGQWDRCNGTGCEWKKVFKKDECRHQVVLPKFVPPQDTKPFYSPRRKCKEVNYTFKRKGRVVKEEKKYTEINPLRNNPVPVKAENKTVNKEIDFSKIGIAPQDDWINKIKIMKNENKNW